MIAAAFPNRRRSLCPRIFAVTSMLLGGCGHRLRTPHRCSPWRSRAIVDVTKGEAGGARWAGATSTSGVCDGSSAVAAPYNRFARGRIFASRSRGSPACLGWRGIRNSPRRNLSPPRNSSICNTCNSTVAAIDALAGDNSCGHRWSQCRDLRRSRYSRGCRAAHCSGNNCCFSCCKSCCNFVKRNWPRTTDSPRRTWRQHHLFTNIKGHPRCSHALTMKWQ
mmetsp:Transcript_127457/g.318244  ORF Transcript_127457/g.318244 Transcript_127457/m.318244 type:complete len:221 (+) Transcript_127457:176-838(+)